MLVAILNQDVREDHVEKVAFEQRPEAGEAVSQVGIWGTSVPGRWDSKCRDPEMVVCWVYLKNSKEACWLECSE